MERRTADHRRRAQPDQADHGAGHRPRRAAPSLSSSSKASKKISNGSPRRKRSPITSCAVRWRWSKARSWKRCRGRSTRIRSTRVQREYRLRTWAVDGAPALSVSVVSRLLYEPDLQAYLETLEKPTEIVGLWVADKTSRIAGRGRQDGRLARRAPRAPARTDATRARPATSSKPRPAITGWCACWRDRANTITSPTRSIW